MTERSSSPIYDEVVRITHVYLGPAADRFIARQVENHLHKSPSQLTKADLADLIDWIQAVVSLITEDSDIIEEFVKELRKLSQASSSNPKGSKRN